MQKQRVKYSIEAYSTGVQNVKGEPCYAFSRSSTRDLY
jgi:hypothetical protein